LLFFGTPVLNSFSCAPLGKDFCSGGEVYNWVSNPDVNKVDRVTAFFDVMTTAEADLASNWQWRPINAGISLVATKNSVWVNSLSFGQTGLEVRTRNSCGWSAWFPLTWELVEIPNPNQKQSTLKNPLLEVYPNPSASNWNFSYQNTIIESITVLDVFGKKLYSTTLSENQVTIDRSSFQKGIYFAKVKTVLGIETVKLVKN
jgi:hypothetical protein